MATTFALPIDGDFYYEFKLTNPDGTPKTGLLDVTASASQSDGGPPVASLPKYAATETSTPGTYAATFVEADLQANIGLALAASSGYVVVYEGAKVLGSDPCVFTAAARTGS